MDSHWGRNVKYWHAPCQFYYARNGENFPFLHRHAIESRMSKNSGLSHGGFGRWNINRPPIIIKHFASKGTNNWWERRNKPQFWIEQANRKVTNCDIYSGISLGLLECHGLLTLRVQGATKIRGVDVFGDEIINEYWIFFCLSVRGLFLDGLKLTGEILIWGKCQEVEEEPGGGKIPEMKSGNRKWEWCNYILRREMRFNC